MRLVAFVLSSAVLATIAVAEVLNLDFAKLCDGRVCEWTVAAMGLAASLHGICCYPYVIRNGRFPNSARMFSLPVVGCTVLFALAFWSSDWAWLYVTFVVAAYIPAFTLAAIEVADFVTVPPNFSNNHS